MVTLTLHSLAFILWGFALFFATVFGSTMKDENDHGTANFSLTVGGILSLIAFTLQVVA